MSALTVVFDGLIYKSQMHGGVSRACNELLPRICDLDPSCSVELLTTSRLRQPVPQHRNIRVQRIADWELRLPRPRAIARRLEPPLNRCLHERSVKRAVGDGDGAVWHSPFYRLPGDWQGPLVVTIYDMVHELFPELFTSATHKWFIRHKKECIRRADAVVCVSETTRADVLRLTGVEKGKTVVVPLGHSEVFRPVESAPTFRDGLEDMPFLLSLGNRSVIKNFFLLLEAYGAWPGRAHTKLVVVGAPWSHREREYLETHGLEKYVVHWPYTADEHLRALYSKASAFIYPSIYEGFGIPLLESMACGCPLVASRIPSTLEVAAEYPIYFEADSVESLMEALDVAVKEGKNTRRVQGAKQRVKRYSWEKNAARTLEVYRDLCG